MNTLKLITVCSLLSITLLCTSCGSTNTPIAEGDAVAMVQYVQKNDKAVGVPTDSTVCLKYAKMFHDGEGVQKSFIGMAAMYQLHGEYTRKNGKVPDYMEDYPDSDPYKLIVRIIDNGDRAKFDPDAAQQQKTDLAKLKEVDPLNGEAMQFFYESIDQEAPDTTRIFQLAERGSAAAILMYMAYTSKIKQEMDGANLNRLLTYATYEPFLYNIIGLTYASNESLQDEEKAVYYLLKADQESFLVVPAAEQMVKYCEEGCFGLKAEGNLYDRFKAIAKGKRIIL